MAADLLGTHRIFFTLLEIRRIAITGEKQSRESVQIIAQLLLKDSGQKLLHAFDEPMDKISKQESKEAVWRTIVEHDKIFRQQIIPL
jgi:CHASE3 domain sensor protein